MSKPFDATLKHLIETYPADWLTCAGLRTTSPVKAIDADVSSVTAEADKVLHVAEPVPWLLHLEVQASRDPQLPDRMLVYNVLLRRRHELPVRSLVVLLCPAAEGPELTGNLEHRYPDRQCYLHFGYEVLRVWEKPLEVFLNGGPGVLPLAPLSAVDESHLPFVAQQMRERLTELSAPADQEELLTATYVQLGLRGLKQPAKQLFGGILAMKGLEESTTYQEIVEEGKLKALKKALLRQGQIRFGPPPESARQTISSLNDLGRLEELMDRVVQVGGWKELLA